MYALIDYTDTSLKTETNKNVLAMRKSTSSERINSQNNDDSACVVIIEKQVA